MEVFILNPRTILSVCLAAALGLPAPGWGQQVSGPKSNLAQSSGDLKITVVQGEGAVNDVRAKTATAPIVEVRDSSDKPVVGAEVVFQLPAAGPGGVFNGWMRTQTARSDEQGRAAADGFAPNDQEGRFNIKVTAMQGTKNGTLVIGQSNGRGTSAQAKGSKKTLWIVLGILAVGGIVGGVAAASGGDSATVVTTVPVTVTPGPVSVGGPR
jgi:hypothetical protein